MEHIDMSQSHDATITVTQEGNGTAERQPEGAPLAAVHEASEPPLLDASVLLRELQRENRALKGHLSEVLATAGTNERIWRHFTEIERILFRTRQLDTLVHELLQEIKVRFQPDVVVLLLCHHDILERFFPDVTEESEPVGEGTWILPFPPEIGQSLCGELPRPLLLSSDTIGKFLETLPGSVLQCRSGVLVPLCIHHILFGALFLGSTDANRYRPQYGTELLEQLGIKIALCMDNCLTYEKVRAFSAQDPITGLLNFFQIHTRLEREFRKALRHGRPLSVLIIDLDFFHELDEQVDMGIEILKHAAGLLKEILPEGESFLGRYGSDEFLVILPDVQGGEAAEVVPFLSQTIRKSPFRHQNTVILIQALIGVATLTGEMERSQDLLDAATSELCRLKMAHASLASTP